MYERDMLFRYLSVKLAYFCTDLVWHMHTAHKHKHMQK